MSFRSSCLNIRSIGSLSLLTYCEALPADPTRGRSVVNAELVIEAPENSRQYLRQIFRNQTGPRLARRLAMHPDPDAGGLERRHALRQHARYHSCQPVAGARSGKPRRRVGGDGSASVRRCHDRIWSLEQHDGARAFGGCAHPFEFLAIGMLVADIAEQPWKFSFMR